MCSLSDRCASLSVYFSCCLASPDSCSSAAPPPFLSLSLSSLSHLHCPLNIAKYFSVSNVAKIMEKFRVKIIFVCVCGGAVYVHISGRGSTVTCLCIISSVFIPRNCLHILMKLPHDACQRRQHAPRQDKEGRQGSGASRGAIAAANNPLISSR